MILRTPDDWEFLEPTWTSDVQDYKKTCMMDISIQAVQVEGSENQSKLHYNLKQVEDIPWPTRLFGSKSLVMKCQHKHLQNSPEKGVGLFRPWSPHCNIICMLVRSGRSMRMNMIINWFIHSTINYIILCKIDRQEGSAKSILCQSHAMNLLNIIGQLARKEKCIGCVMIIVTSQSVMF